VSLDLRLCISTFLDPLAKILRSPFYGAFPVRINLLAVGSLDVLFYCCSLGFSSQHGTFFIRLADLIRLYLGFSSRRYVIKNCFLSSPLLTARGEVAGTRLLRLSFFFSPKPSFLPILIFRGCAIPIFPSAVGRSFSSGCNYFPLFSPERMPTG